MNEIVELERITNCIRGFIFEKYLFGYTEETFSNTTSLLDYGVIDSLGIIELLTFLEKEFSLTVSDDEVLPQNLDSIDRASHFVLRKMAVLKRG
jgi:acyl carrier protein